MSRFLLLSVLLCCAVMTARAQTDSLSSPGGSDPDVDRAIEDLIINVESDEQVDYTFITDYLEELLKEPLNLNDATRDELIRLPGMSDLLAQALIDYVSNFGKLTSVYELQAVSGYRQEVIEGILPYITVEESRAKDISPGKKHAAGPPVSELLNGTRYELMTRLSWIAEEQAGYSEDTTRTRYLGSQYRSFTRFRARYGQNFSIALTGEKDPGEQMRWAPDQKQYGYDLLSGHIAIMNYGSLKRLIIGDYNMQGGQGLILSRGLGFGKGAATITGAKMPNSGLLPYASVNENQFMRGAAATWAFGDVYVTGLFSRLYVDATVADQDSLTAEVILASGLQLSGLHRTESELSNRRSIVETITGGRAEWRRPAFTLGATHYNQQFSSEINRPVNDYNQFDFRGDRNYVSGLDFDWIVRNFNFFGEVARSRSGGLAGVAGLMGSIAPTVDVSVVARHYDKDFHSQKAYVFAERPTSAQNETGVYFGLRIAPNPKFEWNSYFDQFYFPWNKFGSSYPSYGWEFMTQMDYKPRRGTLLYLRYRTDHKELDADTFAVGQRLEYLIAGRRDQFRVHFETKISRDIMFRTRMEFSWYKRADEAQQRGFLIYQDLVWKFGFKWRLTGRYAIFDVSDYDARIYAYENDILGAFSIPPYYNTGSRMYLIVDWKATRRLEFWARVAQTRLQEARTSGTGLDLIQGNTRTEFKLQMRYSF